MLKATIYGDKKDLDEDIKEIFDSTNLSYMLAASGSNIAILVLIVRKICKKLKISQIITRILLIMLISILMALCSFETSITRAGIMGIITIVLDFKSKKISAYKKLGITFFIMYILNPMMIFNAGVQLSFVATFSILLFYQKIYVRIKWKLENKFKVSKSKVLNPFIKMFTVGIAVQIGILPIQINIFNSYSLVSIFSGLILGLVIGVIRSMGIVAIILSFIPEISQLIFKLLNLVITGILKVVVNIQKLNLSVQVASIPVIIILTYYLYILLIFLGDNIVIKKYKISILFGKYIKKFKKIIIVIFCSLVLIYRVYNIFWNNYAIFFNVGQGDMSFISYKGENILIDAGSKSEGLANNILGNYLKKKNITDLDVVVISHFHEDHVNGIIDILKNNEIKVQNILYTIPTVKSNEYDEVKKHIKLNKINSIVVESGDNFSLKNIKIEFISPENKKIIGSDEENSNSIVCNIFIKDKTLLYMGDATIETEKKLIQNKCLKKADVLKIGHHGSNTSTSEEFIQIVNPRVAIISSKKKVFGHPSKTTLDLLKKYNIDTYITEQKGAIKIIM